MVNDQMPVKYNQTSRHQTSRQCAAQVLSQLNLGYEINNIGSPAIAETGPVIVVANYPFGGVESIALLHLLLKHRDDVKILGDRKLKNIAGLAQNAITLHTQNTDRPTYKNITALRQAVRWLVKGGVLVVFPADIAHTSGFSGIRAGKEKWSAGVSRLIAMTGAAVMPVYIENPGPFDRWLFSSLYSRLANTKTYETVAHSRPKKMHLWIGKPIAASRLKRFGTDDETARYLRLHTHMLSSAKQPKLQFVATNLPHKSSYEEIIPPLPPSYLLSEISQLKPEQKLATSANLDVYLARAEQIPQSLREIGRLREITFRAVGEGTGKAIDIDLHDRFYLHLFLWDREKNQIAGAYRLGLSDQIIKQHGKKGLYTQTLFKLHTRFLENLSPAIELGRSFVCIEYQKSISPLMLLWKGIGTFLVRNPQYSTLFGPVSISNDYCSTSRQLLIEFLKMGSFDDPLRKFIKARRPYRGKMRQKWHKHDLANIGSFEGLSDLISLLEDDGKGAPVLMRHYVNIGGRMLDFNVDKSFGNCVDGLVVVDLCKTDDRVLARYLGKQGAKSFKQYHQRSFALAG